MMFRVYLSAVTDTFYDVEADSEKDARRAAWDLAYDDVIEVDRSAWVVTGSDLF